MKEFRDKWPGGFYDKISKQLINIDHKRKHISGDNHKIISQDLIYARAPGFLLIMMDPHDGQMCFKSVKTLGALHS